MAAFKELDWLRFDVHAIANSCGLATIEEQRHEACRGWLSRPDHRFDTLDCSRPLNDVVADLYQLLKWEEQFGYTPEYGKRNLNALRDGFCFEIPEGGGHVLELVRVDLAWQQEPEWILGLLDIAQEYSRWQLALGRRFFALLVVEENSEIIGVKIEETRIPYPFWSPSQAYNRFER